MRVGARGGQTEPMEGVLGFGFKKMIAKDPTLTSPIFEKKKF
jgi:hypothetical protein